MYTKGYSKYHYYLDNVQQFLDNMYNIIANLIRLNVEISSKQIREKKSEFKKLKVPMCRLLN